MRPGRSEGDKKFAAEEGEKSRLQGKVKIRSVGAKLSRAARIDCSRLDCLFPLLER